MLLEIYIYISVINFKDPLRFPGLSGESSWYSGQRVGLYICRRRIRPPASGSSLPALAPAVADRPRLGAS